MADAFAHRGIAYKKSLGYSLEEQIHLINLISRRGGNVYLWTPQEKAVENYLSIEERAELCGEEFSRLERVGNASKVELWIGFKPGPAKYMYWPADRQKLVRQAAFFIERGAEGIVLAMDDTHKHHQVIPKDGEYAARLLEELQRAVGGEKLKAVCGEEYSGKALVHQEYWKPILEVLDQRVMIIWTGAKIWNKTVTPDDFPDLGKPILFWDNDFAADSELPEKAPLRPYTGKDRSLGSRVQGILIHPNRCYPRQLCLLETAFDYIRDPAAYNPKQSWRRALMRCC